MEGTRLASGALVSNRIAVSCPTTQSGEPEVISSMALIRLPRPRAQDQPGGKVPAATRLNDHGQETARHQLCHDDTVELSDLLLRLMGDDYNIEDRHRICIRATDYLGAIGRSAGNESILLPLQCQQGVC
jgi:hypothetical protein